NAAIGINATGFSTLSIDTCSVIGGNYGILITGGAASFATLSDSAVRNSALAGIAMKSHGALIDSRVEGSGGTGVFLQDGVAADAVVSAVGLVSIANASHGVWVESVTAGHNVALNLDRAMLSRNGGNGVFADGSGAGAVYVRATHSTATANGSYGFAQS